MICEKTVKNICCEDISKIENYDKAIADKSQTWVCHHKLELIETGGICNVKQEDLIDWGIYYNRPADELIFMTKHDHSILHNKGKKREPFSKEWKRKLSEAHKGKSAWNKGKHHSEETRKRMVESHKGKPSPTKGKHWKLVDGKRVYY